VDYRTESGPIATNYTVLACPSCHSSLGVGEHSAICESCGEVYRANEYGYLVLMRHSEEDMFAELPSNTGDYIEAQHFNGKRLLEVFLKPLIATFKPANALDVGCGSGELVKLLRTCGVQSYGIDVVSNSKHWALAGTEPSSLFCADATSMPFGNNTFDFVMSLGVIEHIGTTHGHCTLKKAYIEERQKYARELVRVTKPGGTILIAAPNKSFPVDVQHGPRDEVSPETPIRSFLFNKTGLNVHKIWGDYHLPSYAEVRRLFINHAGARDWEALPLEGYFGFGRFKGGFLRPFATFAEAYVGHLPKPLRSTWLNPYVLVRIIK
jgi:23S rRNA (guanine745-N1)-methyltransferase